MMYTKLKSALLVILAASGLLLFAAPVLAQEGPLLDEACNQAPDSPVCNQAANTNTNNNPIVRIIRSAANIIAIAGGVAAVIVIIYSGFMFVTAGGSPAGQRATDTNRIKTARTALMGAIIGLIIIALAWTITRLITDRVL